MVIPIPGTSQSDEGSSPVIVPLEDDASDYESFPASDGLAPEEELLEDTHEVPGDSNNSTEDTDAPVDQVISEDEESELIKQLQKPV